MRQIIRNEKSAAPRRTLEAEPVAEHDTEERALAQERRMAPPRPRSGRALRWGILFFGSVGAFAALVPLVTGVSLSDWLKNANLKAAYSRNNLVYAQGASALKVGNLMLAMEKFEQLSPGTAEARELGDALYPRLMERGDLERAVRVRHQAVAGTQLAPAAVSSLNLGGDLFARKGLDGAVAFLRANPDARALPDLFAEVVEAAALPETAGLEKLAGTLSGTEREAAARALVHGYSSQKDFKKAWTWLTQLKPGPARDVEIGNLFLNWAGADIEQAVAVAETLPPGRANDNVRLSLVSQFQQRDPNRSRRLVAKITDPQIKSMALANLKDLVATHEAVEKALQQAQSQKDPAQQLKGHLTLATSFQASLEQDRRNRQGLRALARRYPPAQKAHDALLRYRLVHTDPTFQKELLERVLDPATKKALADEIADGGPWEARVEWAGGGVSTSRPRNSSSQSSAPGSAR